MDRSGHYIGKSVSVVCAHGDAGSGSGVVPHPQPISDSILFVLKYPPRPLVTG